MVIRRMGNATRVAVVVALLFASFVAWASIAHAATDGLEVHVDREVIRDGETVTLVLRYRGDDGARAAPDLSPLRKDFDVLGSQQSQRTTIVNGMLDRSIDWIVSLAPRATGNLTVPAIRWGGATSAPVDVRVIDGSTPGPPGAAAEPPDLFVEASVDSTAPYVQGQVTYTVRVHDAIGMRDAALTQPTADNVRVEPLGEPRSYQTEVHGRPYHVYEQTFALFPQSSGTIVISPVTLRARITDRARRRTPFGASFFDDFFDDSLFGSPPTASMLDDFFSPGRQVQVRSKAITLSVQARPDGVEDGWFLPATEVTLSETWSPERPTFRVGEAVTRTVTLQALGASSEQLPEVSIPAADGVRQYPDKSTESTLPAGGGTLSIRKQSVAIVPTTAGTTTLPAVEVAWWDVARKEMRTAALPARTVEVLPGAGPAPTPAVAGAAATPVAPEATAAENESTPELLPEQRPSLDSLRPMLLPAIIGVCLMVVAAGAGLRITRRRRGKDEIPPAGPRPRQLVQRIRTACTASDARGARAALMEWARGIWPDRPPPTVHVIARHLHCPAFTDAVRDLDRCLYGRTESRWNGQALWAAFEQARRSASTSPSPPPVLPALYPKGRPA